MCKIYSILVAAIVWLWLKLWSESNNWIKNIGTILSTRINVCERREEKFHSRR